MTHLELKIDFSKMQTGSIVSEPIELDGLTWTLHSKSQPNGSMKAHVQCRPVKNDVFVRCFVEITARFFFGTRRMREESLIEDIKKSENLEVYEFQYGLGEEYIVEVKINLVEIFSRNSFEVRDPVLSDIQLIVGDKILYASKQILAQNSKKFYQMIYEEGVDQISVDDVVASTFQKFMEILYGLKQECMKKEDIYEICALAIRYDSKRCLDFCEIAYLNLTDSQRLKLENGVQLSSSQIGKEYLAKVYEQTRALLKKNEEWKKVEHQIDDWKKQLEIDGVPFEITYDFLGSWSKLGLRCLYKENVHFWEYVVSIKVDGRNPVTHDFHLTNTKPYSTRKLRLGIANMVMISGIRLSNSYPYEYINLKTPREKLTDVVLSVDDEMFYASKQILADSSPYFYAMFYGGFNEKYQTDIALIGIDKGEFGEFLQHIYNPKRVVNESTLEYLMQLSSYYDVQSIRKKCEEWMLFNSELTHARKILLSINMNAKDVTEKLKSRIIDFKTFSKQYGFHELDKDTKIELMKAEKARQEDHWERYLKRIRMDPHYN